MLKDAGNRRNARRELLITLGLVLLILALTGVATVIDALLNPPIFIWPVLGLGLIFLSVFVVVEGQQRQIKQAMTSLQEEWGTHRADIQFGPVVAERHIENDQTTKKYGALGIANEQLVFRRGRKTQMIPITSIRRLTLYNIELRWGQRTDSWKNDVVGILIDEPRGKQTQTHTHTLLRPVAS